MFGGPKKRSTRQNIGGALQTFGAAITDAQNGTDTLQRLIEGRQGQMMQQQQMTHNNAQQQWLDQMVQVASGGGPDAQTASAMLAAHYNGDEYGKSLASNFGAENVGAGEARVFGNGRQTFYNPDVVGLGKNQNEADQNAITSQNNLASQDLRGRELAETIRNNTLTDENTDYSNQTGRISAVTGRERLNFDRETAANGPALTDTKGFEAADKAFGEEYNEWTSGKRADAQKNLEQLDSVIEMLNGEGNYTGEVVGQIPDRLAVLSNTGQARVAARERVEEVVQRNLREVLGAQFTEKEGERLIKRAYNPMLSEEENIYRLTNLANQVRTSIQNRDAKAAYFAQNGTLVGFDGGQQAAPADPLGIR
jgi:hypothetical protein